MRFHEDLKQAERAPPPGEHPASAGGRLRWQQVGFFAFCALVVLHALVVKPYASDFAVVWRAAERALRGEELYRLSELNPFKYSPAAALLLSPLGLLPLGASRAVWAGISAACTWRFLEWTVRRAGAGQPAWVGGLAVVLVSPYVLHHFALGQCDAALLALCVQSEDDAERHPWRSGLALAAAALIKLPVLVLLGPALFMRQGRRVGAVAASLLASVALVALRFRGLEPFGTWRALLGATTPPMLCDAQNQSAWALVCTYLAAPESVAFLPALAAVALAVTLLLGVAAVRALQADLARGRVFVFSVSLYCAAFLSPLGWWTNLISAAPLLALLAGQTRCAAGRVRKAIGVAALVAMAIAGAINFDTVGRAAFDAVLRARHFALASLFSAVALASMGRSERSPLRDPLRAPR